nr:PocR ligand-binding domain-containing protein [uncultured Desulfobacter sp.]
MDVDKKILNSIDFKRVNSLLEGFNQTTGFVTAILDLQGNILSKSGWRQICTDFHRIHPETAKKCKISDTVLANKMSQGEKYHFYKCLNGLVDVAVPIVIKGEHVANLFSGQFFFEKPDPTFFKAQAAEYGFDENSYLKAFEEVPIVSKQKVRAAMGFLLDMTEMISEITFQRMEQIELNEQRKQVEAEQEKLKVQLLQAQKLESVGRLAGGVAHDFNNMLSIILGNTEILMEETDPESLYSENLQEIFKAAQRSAKLTKQLLAFARKQVVNPQVLDLNEVISEMLKMLRRLIGEDIDLKWLPAQALKPIKIDPSQLDQILANLCVNARDAIKSVGEIIIETANIHFDDEYCKDHIDTIPGNYVMIIVTDNGIGMDKETLANIFEPFFTTKSAEKGSGLGLSTVFGIVKQNNGFINVYSEQGQGTTFKIYLPEHQQISLQKNERRIQSEEYLGNETILLVEDEPSIIRLTRLMLERLGYTILSASTPGKAIKIATGSGVSIDMLITDVVMPEMNGKDLAKTLTGHFPDLKCLFMSGYTANVIADHGVLDSGVHFINKPFSKQTLAKKVRDVLNTPSKTRVPDKKI